MFNYCLNKKITLKTKKQHDNSINDLVLAQLSYRFEKFLCVIYKIFNLLPNIFMWINSIRLLIFNYKIFYIFTFKY